MTSTTTGRSPKFNLHRDDPPPSPEAPTMTSNVKLLPLPESADAYSLAAWGPKPDYYTAEKMPAYALANVLHHTATLRYALGNAARDIKALRGVRDSRSVEIEALRAEVERLTALTGGVEVQRDANWQAYSDEKARAERLAEALRDMIELREATQRGEVHPTRHELDIVKDARALIHPTAAQEGKPCAS